MRTPCVQSGMEAHAMSAAPIPSPAEPDPTTFVQQHQAGIWRWLRSLGCDAATAEEHCQDALLAGLHHGVQAWPRADASSWLRTAARNFHWMRLRQERRRPPHTTTELEQLEASWKNLGGDDDGGAAALRALDECVAALPARERHLVSLRYEQALPRATIGAQLGLGVAGVKQALRRARERLRRCIRTRLDPTNETNIPR